MRPYYHYDDAPGGGYGFGMSRRWTSTVKALIIANVAVFALELLFGQPLIEALSFTGTRFLAGAFWQPITYMFVHGGLFHVFFNMLALYFFGGDVERQLGRTGFLTMYFLCGVGGAMLSLFTPQVMVLGASGGVLGVLVAFALMYPDVRVMMFPIFIPIRVKWLAIGFAAFTVLSILGNVQDGTAHFGHLGGMAVGYLFIKGRPWLRSLRGMWHEHQVDSGRRRSEAEQAELDRILEKVHREGITALTNQERDFLNLMSKR